MPPPHTHTMVSIDVLKTLRMDRYLQPKNEKHTTTAILCFTFLFSLNNMYFLFCCCCCFATIYCVIKVNGDHNPQDDINALCRRKMKKMFSCIEILI